MSSYLSGATGTLRGVAYSLTHPVQPQPAVELPVLLALNPAERACAARSWQPASLSRQCPCARRCRHEQICAACGAPLLHFRRYPAPEDDAAVTEWVEEYTCDCPTVIADHVDYLDLAWGRIVGTTVVQFPGVGPASTSWRAA